MFVMGDKVYPVSKKVPSVAHGCYDSLESYIHSGNSKASKFLKDNGYFYVIRKRTLRRLNGKLVCVCGDLTVGMGDFFYEKELRSCEIDQNRNLMLDF